MAYQVSWIECGVMAPGQVVGAEPTDRLHARRFEQGAVRVVSGKLGTEIKWMIGSPSTASLLRALLELDSLPPPFVLRFHLIGWFEEVYAHAADAVSRIEAILARGDRYFPSRAFVQLGDPQAPEVPDFIKKVLSSQKTSEEFAVECVRDDVSQSYVVNRVGEKSAIGRVWGTLTSSYPCQPASRYGDTVSAAYDSVLITGQPHYDQVIAALRMPDNQIHWVPYHRAIFPKQREKCSAVSIVAQIAKVEIHIV